MNLKHIAPEEAIEMIKQGKHQKLWWKINSNTIGNIDGYYMPRADELLKKTWYVEEANADEQKAD